MGNSLPAPRLYVSRPIWRGISRPRLCGILEQDIPHYTLTLVAAPAGYGKTTLLAEWAHTTRMSVAWLSISPQDNDVTHFLEHLLSAWQHVQHGGIVGRLGLLLEAQSPDADAVLSAFIGAAHDGNEQLVFVLDDYQHITEPAIHSAVSFILDRLPQHLHFVLASRSDPPLPLARYRARRQLLEFWADDLRFSAEEAAAFFHSLMGLNISSRESAALCTRAEGWATGLQLVALSRRRLRQLTDTPEAVSGQSRFIADYLAQEVLAELPPAMQAFLLSTSILDRLAGQLCDAVTGGANGQAMLEAAERDHLFLLPLDDRRQWFRYHSLFAEFLRGELARRYPERAFLLHRRAAAWYARHDFPEQAFQHALDGDDAELVIEIIERYAPAKLLRREISVLERWIAALPEEWFVRYASLSIFQAGLLFSIRSLEACSRCLEAAEQVLERVEGANIRPLSARATAIRCGLACLQNDLAQVELFADQSLRDLAEDDVFFRTMISHTVGDAYRYAGRWEQAKAYYLRALEFTQASSFRFWAVHLLGSLADLNLRQGRLHSAVAYWNEALQVIQERASRGSLPLPVIGWIYIRIGEILYEWNRLAEAEQRLSQGMERIELGGDSEALIAGSLLSGRLKLAEGNLQAAGDDLARGWRLLERGQFPEWTARLQRLQVELWLAQNRLRAATSWADQMLRGAVQSALPRGEIAQLAIVRVLTVKGDAPSLERALALLARLLSAAEQRARVGVVSEALAIQALLHWRRGDHTGALAALERALSLSEPEGAIRRFVDLGPAMARLLQAVQAQRIMPDYVATLLAAFPGEPAAGEQLRRALPELLTAREREILKLLADGLTNREIAARLVISAGTVKKHTGNIYGKLGASNRTEAAARARELNLLDE